MITIFTVPSRNYNNRSFTTNLVRLSQHTPIENFWFVFARVEIESVDPGAILTITYDMQSGSGEHLGGSTTTKTQPGRFQIGFSRGDFDALSNIVFTIDLVGRMVLNAVLYIAERGEDIPEWL